MNPNVILLIAEGIGLAIVALSLVTQQFKKMSRILAMEILLNFMAGFSEFLKVGHMTSGAWVCLVASVNAVLMWGYMTFGNADDRRIPNILCVVFALLHIAIGTLSAARWYDVFSIVGAALSSVAALQTKARNYRIMRIVNGGMWITYHAIAGNPYSLILNQLLCIISALTAIWRLDIKKKEKDTI